MKRPLSISLSLVFLISFTSCLLLAVNTMWGQEFIPPVPDKSKTLPANDGGPDGCDSSRFTCVMGGKAVLDKQTGLVWARDTESIEKKLPWSEAMKLVEDVEIGGKKGWRLPTGDELISILDTSRSRPALPEGHPFLNINIMPHGGAGHKDYWTSTEYEEDNQKAWMISFENGKVFDSLKLWDYRIFPVRDSE